MFTWILQCFITLPPGEYNFTATGEVHAGIYNIARRFVLLSFIYDY